jgi:hypothetical protein
LARTLIESGGREILDEITKDRERRGTGGHAAVGEAPSG